MPEPLHERMFELLAISREIASATDHTTLPGRVVEHVARFLGAPTAVLLLSSDDDRLRIAASVGLPQSADGFEGSLDESIGAKLCSLVGCDTSRFLAAPVVESGRVQGILAVHLDRKAEAEDEALLSGLADQAAIAIAHVRHVQQLQQALSMLRDVDRRKDEFLSMLSHEIRNPLAPIRASIFILDHTESNSQAAAHARLVLQRQTDHLTRLIDDLLDITRITRGRIHINSEPVDVVEVARRAAEDHRSMMATDGLRLTLQLDVPHRQAWVSGDATRLAQVIGNLLQNAAKFTPAGGTVALNVRIAGGQVEIRVCDTGVGIDPAFKDSIFEPFVQAGQPTSRSPGGLGLGLALVKSVVELHGGTVRAESEGSGHGSNFVVSLPLGAASKPGSPPVSFEGRAVPAKRIVVIDDNHDAADSMAELLQLLGHSVEVAYDGPDALARVLTRPPDVVLCDLGLPGMSGYELGSAIRKGLGDSVRLIAVSGYAQSEDVRRSLDCGFDAHIAKPADPEEIERLMT